MSYREENGQVVLTMSREDYQSLIYKLGVAGAAALNHSPENFRRELEFMNRLNEGNPNYRPYEVPPK
jgi:hypothetical protein